MEELENVGELTYKPVIGHGLLYIRPEIIGPNDSVVYDGDEPIVLKPGRRKPFPPGTICEIEGCYGQHPECKFSSNDKKLWSWGDDITEDHIIRGTE